MQDRTNEKLKKIYEEFYTSVKPAHKAYIESIHALVRLTETRDPYTKDHSTKTAEYAVSLAEHVGLAKKEVEDIRLAGLLHDIGKLGVSVAILMKPASLDEEEYAEIKKHPEIAVEILKPLKFLSGLISIVMSHHENYDGTGYPHGLKGNRIPLGARVLIIADVYDALTSDRAYRKAYSNHEAIAIMKYESGKKFDPELLENFLDYISYDATKKSKKRR